MEMLMKGMRKICFAFIMVHFFFTLNSHALEESPSNPPANDVGSLSHEETILLSNLETEPVVREKNRFYFIKTGGSYAFYDEDFREFVDFGGAISVGVEQEVTKKLSARITLDLLMLKGDWRTGGDRESITASAEQWFPGYVPLPGQDITAEDLPDANLGTGYFGGGEAVVISAESLQSIDVETTLYLLPITFNAIYWLHKEEKKMSPYIGGGLGFCLARREAESSAIKEESFEGPEYRIDFNESQVVTGLLVQFFAGIEIPFKDKIKLVAEANTTLYSLRNFDPIMEISYKVPNPDWYEGSDLSQWNYETPLEIGVFQETFISSIMIGIVIPF